MLKRAIVLQNETILAMPTSPLLPGCLYLSVFRDRSAIGLPSHQMLFMPTADDWRYATAADFESFNVHHHVDYTESTEMIAA